MSETVVRVELRQATLTESARLREAGDRMFLALENPPPVRSLLRLRAGDELSAFEVARVIEVVDETEPARGCYGHTIPLERLVEQQKVGSEHLEPGARGGAGVPSPVVIMNTADMMLGEDSGVYDIAARAAELRESDGAIAQGDDESGDDESTDDGEPTDPQDG